MNRKILLLSIVCAALMGLLLAGCGGGVSLAGPTPLPFTGGEVAPDAGEVTMVLQSGETALLDSLPGLRSADLSGSECIEEIAQWAAAHPEVQVLYTVTLPTGETVRSDAESVDLSALTGSQAAEAARCLACLPKVTLVSLGQERDGLSWEDIRLLRESCPQADFDFSFTLYGCEFRLEDASICLSHIPIDDGGALVKRVVACMPDLHSLDMDSCGVSDQDMAAIRDEFPNVKVIWRIWFGDAYSVRTDVERILASTPTSGGMLYPGNYDSLKYCTEVKYLDVGHNDDMSDISFVGYMPKLEVAVLAMANWSDASALANCSELEYLELQTTELSDLTPLAGLTKLEHLNIAYCRNVSDISPLYGLKKLERLWIGCIDPVPAEQIAEMQRAVPGCEINTEVYDDPTGGRWRYVDYNELAYFFILHPRYEELRKQFDDYASSAFSLYWNDPLY